MSASETCHVVLWLSHCICPTNCHVILWLSSCTCPWDLSGDFVTVMVYMPQRCNVILQLSPCNCPNICHAVSWLSHSHCTCPTDCHVNLWLSHCTCPTDRLSCEFVAEQFQCKKDGRIRHQKLLAWISRANTSPKWPRQQILTWLVLFYFRQRYANWLWHGFVLNVA